MECFLLKLAEWKKKATKNCSLPKKNPHLEACFFVGSFRPSLFAPRCRRHRRCRHCCCLFYVYSTLAPQYLAAKDRYASTKRAACNERKRGGRQGEVIHPKWMKIKKTIFVRFSSCIHISCARRATRHPLTRSYCVRAFDFIVIAHEEQQKKTNIEHKILLSFGVLSVVYMVTRSLMSSNENL